MINIKKFFIGYFLLIVVLIILLVYKKKIGAFICFIIMMHTLSFIKEILSFKYKNTSVFLLMEKPIYSKNVLDIVYSITNIYLYNAQYTKIYTILKYIYTDERPNKNFKKVAIQIPISFIVFIVFDTTLFLLKILKILILSILQIRRDPYMCFLHEFNQLIVGSYKSFPKKYKIQMIYNVGIIINPNNAIFNAIKTKVNFYTSIGYSKSELKNSMTCDFKESMVKKSNTFKQINIKEAFLNNSSRIGNHKYVVDDKTGWGMAKTTKYNEMLDNVHIGYSLDKMVFGNKVVVEKLDSTYIKDELNKTEQSMLADQLHNVFSNKGDTIIVSNDGKSFIKHLDNKEFKKLSNIDNDFFETPYFSIDEVLFIKKNDCIDMFF